MQHLSYLQFKKSFKENRFLSLQSGVLSKKKVIEVLRCLNSSIFTPWITEKGYIENIPLHIVFVANDIGVNILFKGDRIQRVRVS